MAIDGLKLMTWWRMDRYLEMISFRPAGTVIINVKQEGRSFFNAKFISLVWESPRMRIRWAMVNKSVKVRLTRGSRDVDIV